VARYLALVSYLFPHKPIRISSRLLSSALNRIESKLRKVSDRIGTVGLTANDEDIRIVSELVEDIRDAVIDYQVSGGDLKWLLWAPH